MIMATGVTQLEETLDLKELWAETIGDPRVCIAVLDGPAGQLHLDSNAFLTPFMVL